MAEKKDKSAAEMRKINKPLMERKRRERINNCLNQLKTFLMETTKKDSSYYSKLEKADILELTVKYLKSLQRQQLAVAMVSDPKVASKYTAGYSQCASEVSRYLGKLDGFSPEVQSRLVQHLTGCVQKVATTAAIAQAQNTAVTQLQGQATSVFPAAATTAVPQSAPTTASHTQARPDSPDIDPPTVPTSPPAALPATVVLPGGQTVFINANLQQQQLPQQPAPQPQSQQQQQNVPVLPLQLIPAKLPSGDMVFLMANTQPAAAAATAVPMATNFVTSPVSIQIPSATVSHSSPAAVPTSTAGTTTSGSTKAAEVATNLSTTNSTNNNVSHVFGLNNPMVATAFSHTLTATGVSSVVPSLASLSTGFTLSSGSAVATSAVAVVPPNVHECKPSPSSIPTDLSMKSSTSAATGPASPTTSSPSPASPLPSENVKCEDMKTTIMAPPPPFMSPFTMSTPHFLTMPTSNMAASRQDTSNIAASRPDTSNMAASRLNTSNMADSRPDTDMGGAMSLLSMAAESRRRAEDENNNDVVVASTSATMSSGAAVSLVAHQRAKIDNGPEVERQAINQPHNNNNVQPGYGDEEPGPSGLGPMWRPW